MVEEASNNGSDKKRKKGGSILSILDVKYVAIVSNCWLLLFPSIALVRPFSCVRFPTGTSKNGPHALIL